MRMKACYAVILIIQTAAVANFCSTNMVNLAVDNGLISCFSNNTCIAECYRGYIFPSGNTKESYSCQNGNLTPMISTCNRIPVVNVTYSTMWTFAEILTSSCNNISSRLDVLKGMLEETVSRNCLPLNIKSSVMFTYFLFAFTVNAQFTAIYRDFTNRQRFDVCIQYNTLVFPNLQIIRTLFECVTCGNLSSSNKIVKNLFVSEILEYCNDNMQIHNVTTEPGQFELFCDKTATIETPILGKSTSSITAVNEDMFTSDFSNMHQTSTNMFSKQTTSNISDWKTSIYILAPVAVVFLVFGVAIFLVRLRKRAQAPEREKSYDTIITGGQTQYINMADNTHHYDVIGYRSERRQESGS